MTATQQQPYDEMNWELDYRQNPDKYVVGTGEFGVLMYQPYKSEILPHWEYKDEDAAHRAAPVIYEMFCGYLDHDDFPGADMARKYLQMGFTRAMRYAKYPGGKKYDEDGTEREQITWADPDKRAAAVVYKEYWDCAREHSAYQRQREAHTRSDSTYQATLTA